MVSAALEKTEPLVAIVVRAVPRPTLVRVRVRVWVWVWVGVRVR